jgi:hypothetical protein
VLALAATVAGCGKQASSSGLPPAVSAPATFAPDGSVPFVDEPAGLREFDIPLPQDPDPGDARPCNASQLSGELASWILKGQGTSEEVPRATPGLFGYVNVRLTSGKPCTLQGLVSTELLIDGRPAPVKYSNSVTREAERRVTLVTAERSADLRLDWSPPYCGPTGAQTLVISLPHDGGTLDAHVVKPTTPVCTGASQEGSTTLRTYVSTDIFSPHAEPTVLDSPLSALRATLQGAPTRARAGETLRFRIRLSNPSGTAVSLRPCPGFLQERFIHGTQGRTGFNTSQLYRLNCRPVSSIAARGHVDFQMEARVPDDPPGPTFDVTWRLVAPYLAGEPGLRCAFSVPVSS